MRRRIAAVGARAPKRAGPALRRRRLVAQVRLESLTRRVDRALDRRLVRAWPPLARGGRRLRAWAVRWRKRFGRWLRPAARALFRALARLERLLLASRDRAVRLATAASAVLTPERAICLTIAAAAGCLAAAQFVDYHAVEIGQPGYAGLSAASAPRVGAEAAGAAHAYLLLAVAIAAAALALVALPAAELPVRLDSRDEPATRPWRRRRLGWIVFGLGLISLAVVLLVDLPAGLDAGEFTSRFSGATAVLLDGFYAQVAAAAGLMLGGLLLSNAHRIHTRHGYRPRKPSLARTQGGRRRARTLSG